MKQFSMVRAARWLGRAGGVVMVAAVALALPLTVSAMKVVSEKTLTGFKFPESVGCDVKNKVFYVSEFVSELKPTQKDGKGRISKVSLDGEVMMETFLPAGDIVLHKPKGIWIEGDRLWVTDIDAVWEFYLPAQIGKKVELPGIQFANDPTIVGETLYVSDNRGDALYSVEPAEFLDHEGDPKVTVVWSGKDVNPNGVYPAADGSLLLVGFKSKEEKRGIYTMAMGSDPKPLSDGIGRLDGIYQAKDGTLLVTDWNSGSLFSWSAGGGMTTLADGFTGPADFCVMPTEGGMVVAVPDLVKSTIRLVTLGM